MLIETQRKCQAQLNFEPFLDVLADEPDNRILETAVKGRAQYVATGDKQLLALKSYQDIQVITVSHCLELAS